MSRSNHQKNDCANFSPAASKRDILKTALQTVLTVFVGFLVSIGNDIKKANTRIEATITKYENRITRIEAWMGEGRRYTKSDAESDLGVLTNVLESQGRIIDDHEARIRKIELAE